MFLHIFMKQHQALSHRTGEGNLHHTSPPRFGSPRSVWGCLGFFFPVPEKKSTQTIQSYMPPCQTHSEAQWDEEEPTLGKVLVAFNAPATDTVTDRTPVITTTQSVFHRGNPTALATGTWWAIASSLPQLEADLQIGNQIAPSSERLGLAWTHREINDRFSTARWFTTNCRAGMLLIPW